MIPIKMTFVRSAVLLTFNLYANDPETVGKELAIPEGEEAIQIDSQATPNNVEAEPTSMEWLKGYLYEELEARLSPISYLRYDAGNWVFVLEGQYARVTLPPLCGNSKGEYEVILGGVMDLLSELKYERLVRFNKIDVFVEDQFLLGFEVDPLPQSSPKRMDSDGLRPRQDFVVKGDK